MAASFKRGCCAYSRAGGARGARPKETSDEMRETVFNFYWNALNSIKAEELPPYKRSGEVSSEWWLGNFLNQPRARLKAVASD